MLRAAHVRTARRAGSYCHSPGRAPRRPRLPALSSTGRRRTTAGSRCIVDLECGVAGPHFVGLPRRGSAVGRLGEQRVHLGLAYPGARPVARRRRCEHRWYVAGRSLHDDPSRPPKRSIPMLGALQDEGACSPSQGEIVTPAEPPVRADDQERHSCEPQPSAAIRGDRVAGSDPSASAPRCWRARIARSAPAYSRAPLRPLVRLGELRRGYRRERAAHLADSRDRPHPAANVSQLLHRYTAASLQAASVFRGLLRLLRANSASALAQQRFDRIAHALGFGQPAARRPADVPGHVFEKLDSRPHRCP